VVKLEEVTKVIEEEEELKKLVTRYLNERQYLWDISEMYKRVFSEPDSKVAVRTNVDYLNLLLTIELSIEGGTYIKLQLAQTWWGLLLVGYVVELKYQSHTYLQVAYSSVGNNITIKDDTETYFFTVGSDNVCPPDLDNEYIIRRLLTHLLLHAFIASRIPACVADSYLLIAQRVEEATFPKEKPQEGG